MMTLAEKEKQFDKAQEPLRKTARQFNKEHGFGIVMHVEAQLDETTVRSANTVVGVDFYGLVRTGHTLIDLAEKHDNGQELINELQTYLNEKS